MTTFEALMTLSQIVIRQRGQWHGGATAYDDIDLAVNNCADLLPQGTRILCDMAVAELKRRAGGLHCHVWAATDNWLIDRCTVCCEERA